MKRKGAADSDADILLNNELHREQAWGLGQMGESGAPFPKRASMGACRK